LAEPAKLNPDHRMPVFDLTAGERTSLSLYLASLGKSATPVKDQSPAADLVAAGRRLVATHRCANCRARPKDPDLVSIAAVKPLSAKSDWIKSCAAKIDESKAH